ncbi:hypothetical protein BC628DRAFT_986113 [Trametes gibbosa]|nr:hypothetical protein BC628DRAFT_986113 [Trametes gibbosa]
MLRSLLRLHSPHVLRCPGRGYASASSAHDLVQVTTDTLLASYRRHSSHPSLALVHALRNPADPPAVSDVLGNSGVLQEEYEQWKSVATAPSIAAAFDRAQDILASTHSATAPSNEPNGKRAGVLPDWALLSILCNQPTSRMEAFVAHRLVVANPIVPAFEPAVFIHILAAFWLAKMHMYSLHQTIVLRLAKFHKHLQDYQVSMLLRVLVQGDPPPDLHHTVMVFLRIATRYKMTLGSRTYRALLGSPIASSTIAWLVERHMKSLDYVPNLSHTCAFVRLYAKDGRRVLAARHWRRLRHGQFHGQVPAYIRSADFQANRLAHYLASFRDAKNIRQYILYLIKNVAPRGRQIVRDAFAPKPALRKSDEIPTNVWLQVLWTAAKDTGMPTPRLLELLQHGISILRNPTKAHIATVIVIKSLLRRQEYNKLAPLLSVVLQRKHLFDTTQVTIFAEALTMLNRPDAAFRLLREFDSTRAQYVASTAVPEIEILEELPRPSSSHTIDIQAVNTFMIALLRIGRPDAVFYIWDTMPQIFPGVEPNSASLAILFKAARFARKCEGTLQVALQDFGLRRILPGRVAGSDIERAPQRLGRDEALMGLEWLLEKDTGRVVTGFWRGERAGAVALRLAWRILVGNWPALAELESPVRHIAAQQTLSPVADLYHNVHLRQRYFADDIGGDEDIASDSAAFPADEEGRTFFGIIPHDVMFRSLLDLLAAEERAGQIPLVLVWMKYLGVRPSGNTLATALVYWSEVSLDGPLIETWKGEGRSKYAQLVRWMEKWVGRHSMPTREEMQGALNRVRWFRDTQKLRPRQMEGEDGDLEQLYGRDLSGQLDGATSEVF